MSMQVSCACCRVLPALLTRRNVVAWPGRNSNRASSSTIRGSRCSRIVSSTPAAEGTITADEAKEKTKEFRARLQEGLLLVREGKYKSVSQVPEAMKNSLRYVEVLIVVLIAALAAYLARQ